MLPKVNGIDILKEVRSNNIDSKVIMLTAKGELDDKLLGFNSGANDYISKPFSREQIQEKLELVFKDSNSNHVIETDTPTYNPNVDRFKDNPAYVFDGKKLNVVDKSNE